MFKDKEFIEWKKSNPSFDMQALKDGFAGLSKYYGLCTGGHICLEGSANSVPAGLQEGYECPVGHYCPDGATVALRCPPGYRNPQLGQSVCIGCAPRTFCPQFGMTEGLECEEGSYCRGTDGSFPSDGD